MKGKRVNGKPSGKGAIIAFYTAPGLDMRWRGTIPHAKLVAADCDSRHAGNAVSTLSHVCRPQDNELPVCPARQNGLRDHGDHEQGRASVSAAERVAIPAHPRMTHLVRHPSRPSLRS